LALALRAHYSRFLGARPGVLHFAAHSHHLWPDVTRDAVVQAWDDAARLADHKWDHVLGAVLPRVQAHVARILGFSRPEQIAFAPNTHELVARVFSCFEPGRGLRVLTTDGEFMSFARQLARLEESGEVHATRVPTEPFETFDARFHDAAAAGPWDLVYLSHVFFNSGFAVRDLGGIVAAVREPRTIVMIDGYHGFLALPVRFEAMEQRLFYVAGGYKYAQSGEGACFLHVPPGCALRPRYTGWFARFGRLTGTAPDRVEYPDDAFRFWGSTFDPTGLYRLGAVLDWLAGLGVGVAEIHAHVQELQRLFLEMLARLDLRALPLGSLVTPPDLSRQGHFLTFRLPRATELAAALRARGVDVDSRADRVRFRFGLYHEPEDIERLAKRLRTL
jgi:selenocysteine lyase/cysteine desulfurase